MKEQPKWLQEGNVENIIVDLKECKHSYKEIKAADGIQIKICTFSYFSFPPVFLQKQSGRQCRPAGKPG
jgi:hypothetical protein